MISAIVLTKNEEKNIIDCLDSISWTDEIVIIDDYSEDRTLEVVKNLSYSKKIKSFQRNLNENFSSQRNFALSKAKYDWVLFIDADEVLSKGLRDEINLVVVEKIKKFSGYYIKREDFIWGKHIKHGEFGDIRLLRFAKKNSGDWIGEVHEKWIVEEPTSAFDEPIFHFPHQTVSEFIRELNFYTSIRAKELFKSNVKTNLLEIIFYTKGKFIINYIFRLGFLDGVEGFILALFMSMHTFLVRGKLWLLWTKKYD